MYMYMYVGIDEPGKHLLLQCCYAGTLTKYCIVGRESFVVNKFSWIRSCGGTVRLKYAKFHLHIMFNMWHKTGTSILKYFETIRYTA